MHFTEPNHLCTATTGQLMQGVGDARHLTITAAPPAADRPAILTDQQEHHHHQQQQPSQHLQQPLDKYAQPQATYQGLSVHEVWVALQEEGGALAGKREGQQSTCAEGGAEGGG